MIRAVLFDLDGTLIDSSEGITKSAQYALAHFGIDEPDLNKLMFFIGPPLSYTFANVYGFSGKKNDDAIRIYRDRYVETGIFECSLYPGVREILQKLKDEGYLIGMASSKPEVSCIRILEHFDILSYFDDVVGATEDGSIDTKEQVLNEVLRRWEHIPKDQMCLIGDTLFDIEGANAVEMTSIGVSFGFGDLEAMKRAGAVAICDSMDEVLNTIHSL